MKLHLPSVLASIGVVALVALLTSQSGPLVAGGYRIEYMPHPRDMVQIKDATPFVVPANKLLVITALGSTGDFATTINLSVNGQIELTGYFEAITYPGRTTELSVLRAPEGFSIPAGSTVTLNGPSKRAWGYLANQ